MDCQFIMGFFSYVYYQSFIAVHNQVTVGAVLESVVTQLSLEDQIKVVQGLHQYLAGQGVLDSKV
jgi:phosphatidate cytidylyltransferase